MRNTILLVTLSVALSTPGLAQSVSKEQCRNLSNMILAVAQNAYGHNQHISGSYSFLETMQKQLSVCMTTDGKKSNDYTLAMLSLDAEMHERLREFVVRHNLWSQFVEEDAAADKGRRPQTSQ